MKTKSLIGIAFLFCLACPISVFAEQPHIVWFSTLNEDTSEKSGFWKRVHDLTIAAAEDLDLKFEVYYAEENFVRLKKQVSMVLEKPALRPDGIIFHNYKLTGEHILRQAETFGVKSIIFNAGLQKETSLSPRQELKFWIGEVLPDDAFAGAELLRHLQGAAELLSPNSEPFSVVAMAGNPSSAAYQARARGMLAEVERDVDLLFLQFVPADWSRDTARKQFSNIRKRYPDNKIFWAANDNMALGLIDGAQSQGLVPGRDFVTGGVDWLPEALERIQQGQIEASVGGHFVEGMWALILLYDHLNGFDFAEDYGVQLRTKMLALTRDNLSDFGDIGEIFSYEELKQSDFSNLSRTHNRDLEKYPFDIGAFIHFLSSK